MQKILILGIGRSTYYLLQYLNVHIASKGIAITALDAQTELVEKRRAEFPNITFIQSDIDATTILEFISAVDLVVSMLPPSCHGSRTVSA